jgi:hypothetical protein
VNRTNVKAIIDLLLHDIVRKAEALREPTERDIAEAKQELISILNAELTAGRVTAEPIVSTGYYGLNADVKYKNKKVEAALKRLNSRSNVVNVVIRSPLGRNSDARLTIPVSHEKAFEKVAGKFTDMSLALLTADDEQASKLVAELRSAIATL